MKLTQKKDITNYCSVYFLFDNIGIRYVGVAVDPVKRQKIRKWQSTSKKSKMYNLRQSRWYRKHENEIRMRIVFIGTEEECYLKEIELIRKCRQSGRDLVNVSEGGDRPPRINRLDNYNEIIEKIRQKSIGRKVSNKTKKIMSISHKGKMTHLKKYHKKGAENNNASKIDQYDLNNNFIRSWDTIKEAAIFYNISSSSICDVLKNRTKTCAKFKWKYHKINNNL